MATTNGNRKLLDLKRWEWCNPAPIAASAGVFIVSSNHYRQQQLAVYSSTSAALYSVEEDAYTFVANPTLAGTFGAGACGAASAYSTGASVGVSALTATAGTTLSITTNQTIARDLRGYSVFFTAGTNAGKLKTIASNTIGANAVITFDSAEAVAFDATSQFRLKTPCWYVLNAGTLAAGIFKKYDFATNTWTSLTQTGLPATIGNDSKLIATPAWIGSGFKSFASGTATAGGASTLTNSAKSWATNQWANYQIRISGGTGAGQIRTVASNTGTVITVGAAWTTTPDATSTYSIEGNDDFLYYIGNNFGTLYRYSISANTWSTITPGVARAGSPSAGLSGHWIWNVQASDWTNESAIKNGRYLYSFRAVATAALDRYDIAANTWEAVTYAPAAETFTTGTKYTYNKNRIYINKDAGQRWLAFDFVENAMQPWSVMTYPQSTAVVGDTCFDATYADGATEIDYIYLQLNSLSIVLRQMVI